MCLNVPSLEVLKEKSEHEISSILIENNAKHEEELRRLCRALHNLRRYMGMSYKPKTIICLFQNLTLINFTDVLVRGDMEDNEMNLYWDSWDRHHLRSGPSPRPQRTRVTRSSIPSEDSIPYNNNINNNNLINDTMLPASSIISLTSNTPPTTPLLVRQARGNKLLS